MTRYPHRPPPLWRIWRLRDVIRMVRPLPPWLASVLGVAGLLLVLAAGFALVRFVDAAWAGGVTRPGTDTAMTVAQATLEPALPPRPGTRDPAGLCLVSMDDGARSVFRLDGRACTQIHEGDRVMVRTAQGRVVAVAGWSTVPDSAEAGSWAAAAVLLGVSGALLTAVSIASARRRRPNSYDLHVEP